MSSNKSVASKHVKVFIRTRPTSDFALENLKINSDQKSITVHMKKSDDGGFINNQQEQWHFQVDGIFHNATQDFVYEESVNSIAQGLLNGYNGTVLAYGQTGSGKTFTMTGATENYKHRGIIPRAISQIFKMIGDKPELQVKIRVSYLEIYNESVIDLLTSLRHQDDDSDNSLSIVEDKITGSTIVKGLTISEVSNEEDALNLLFEGENNRSISEHELNKRSSRSHCIFTIYVESRSRVESSEKVTFAKLNLVDLAGSERLSKTKSDGATLKEAMYINRSLTYLEQVILALADRKRDHVPYRQSKLTNVLRDSLGGNCQTLMIGNIRCENSHLEETISTLRFAMRMMCVVTNPMQNIQSDPMALVKKYERMIKDLKQELSMHDTLSNRSHIQYEPFSESQRAELLKTLKSFLDGQEDEIEIVSLRQIKECFSQFRSMYRNLEAELEDRLKSRGGTDRGDEKSTDYTGKETSFLNKNANATIDGDENAIGDLEGAGFGVGLAPLTAKPASGVTGATSIKSAKGSKDKKTKGAKQANEDDDFDTNPSPVPPMSPTNEQKMAASVPSNQAPTVKGNPSSASPVSSNVMNDIVQNIQNQSMSRIQSPIGLAGKIPNRNEEFEKFKVEQGSDLYKILNENKGILKDKKAVVRALAEQVNDLKLKIEDIKEQLMKMESQPVPIDDFNEFRNDGTKLIDEEQYKTLVLLKETKGGYKKAFENWKSARSEMEYCERMVGQCRERFLSEFEQWFEDTYGSFVPVDVIQSTSIQAKTNSDDVMDIGEKFEKLHLERVSNEDPNSVPFYNALRQQERKQVKGMKKANSKMGRLGGPKGMISGASTTFQV